jgi:hypothetical protein
MWLCSLISFVILAHSASTVRDAVVELNEASHKSPAQNCTDFSCHDEDKVGCEQQYNSFCHKLYSVKNPSNMDVPLSDGNVIQIRYGKNDKNDYYSFVAFNQAKIKNKDKLPADLKAELDKSDYFKALQDYLDSKKVDSVRGNVDATRNWGNVNYIWRNAVTDVILARVEKVIPNYGNKSELSPREIKKGQEIGDQVRVEINKSIWDQSPEWEKVKSDFSLIKKEFLSYLNENTSLSLSTRKKMIAKITALDLILPGTNILSIDDDCVQTERNAYYTANINKLTICAGLFSVPSIAIMAHEIAHSIDPHNLLRDDFLNSTAGKSFKSYLQKSCSESKPSCNDWNTLKQQLVDFNPTKGSYYSEAYLQCLRHKKLTPWPEKSTVNEIVSMDINSYVDRMARQDAFLGLSVPQKRNEEGKKIENIEYMNVCNMYDEKPDSLDLDDGVVTALAYSSEFRCSKITNAGDKLKSAVNAAKDVGIQFQNKFLESQKSLADDSEMIRRGYATPIGEKAADNIGLKIAARVIDKKYQATKDKRNVIFTSLSLFCDGFTMDADNPDLASAQKEFSSEEHSQNSDRRKELMTNDMRKTLDCDKDFETMDCEL